MRRIRLFLYFYLVGLRVEVHGVNIRGVKLAWNLARIASS